MVDLRQAHLEEGFHWKILKKEVCLSPAAVERLKAELGCPDSQNGKNGQDEALGASAAPILLVVKRAARNVHILFAEKKEGGDGTEVRVRVRSNLNFLAGMEIRATPTEYADFYDLAGRCPRQRGRW